MDKIKEQNKLKENKISGKRLPIQHYSPLLESNDIEKEERELYLFLRGGFGAK